MRILLTGATGLVGGAFSILAGQAGHKVIGIAGASKLDVAGLSERRAVDLSELDAVSRLVDEVAPEAIVNAAAISEPYRCDEDPVLSFALNVSLPETLARASNRAGIRFVHLSSEQAFDGTRPPYRRDDPVSPINRYAEQKVQSEAGVVQAAPSHTVVIRAPLLMGDSVSTRRSLHERLFADWMAGKTPRLFIDEFRQTCTARSLAVVMLALCERPQINGIYHWAGAELLSRHEQGLRIRSHFDLPEKIAPIAAVTRDDSPSLSAKRQPNLALDLTPLPELLQITPESFADQLSGIRVPAWAEQWWRARHN